MLSDDLESLLPKNIFDDSGLNILSSLSESEIAPIVPKLIRWMADINWPVAFKVRDVLAKFPYISVNIVRDVLKENENDNILKFWTIRKLIPFYPYECQLSLLDDLKRICYAPTEGEKSEEVDIYAAELISKIVSGVDKRAAD